ncbi:hypothetical protein ACF1A5_11790 [Streptomyces sp. NPDC014864]|uniref:hypothetical protein n=1 Tax=Streptomyces sp. NPDC014864 TaxID=3364924 RepID=UPI0036FDB460
MRLTPRALPAVVLAGVIAGAAAPAVAAPSPDPAAGASSVRPDTPREPTPTSEPASRVTRGSQSPRSTHGTTGTTGSVGSRSGHGSTGSQSRATHEPAAPGTATRDAQAAPDTSGLRATRNSTPTQDVQSSADPEGSTGEDSPAQDEEQPDSEAQDTVPQDTVPKDEGADGLARPQQSQGAAPDSSRDETAREPSRPPAPSSSQDSAPDASDQDGGKEGSYDPSHGQVPGGDPSKGTGGHDSGRDQESGRDQGSGDGGMMDHGVQAGEGGTFAPSLPALVTGGVLIAAAFGAAGHRLWRRGRTDAR